MRVDEVHFNHDPSSASSDALNIRQNSSGTAIVAPEWKFGLPARPAAYAVAALTGTVTIKAKFTGGPPNSAATIRAIDAYVPAPTPGGCLGWLIAWFAALIRALFGNVLGHTDQRVVHFDGAGNSGLVEFTLVHHKLTNAPVGIRTTDWKWQYRTHKHWHDFDTTQHRIFIVLDIPRAPWNQNSAGNNTQLPWVDALEKACQWAIGASSRDMAAGRITVAINTQPNQSYTPMTMFGWTDYYLSSYINQLNSGLPFQLNCTDCADAVTTFANLLGCDLWEGRFFNMVTRKFLTLNGNPAVEADWVSWSWGYHEICWLQQIGQNELVYDGCLQLDMDNNYADMVHVAQQPIKMRFGMNDPSDYRYRLIESGAGTLENIPRRRPVS